MFYPQYVKNQLLAPVKDHNLIVCLLPITLMSWRQYLKVCEMNLSSNALLHFSPLVFFLLKVNAYSCLCPPGYSGDLCEEEVDLCIVFPCENGGTCNVVDGQVQCDCISGKHEPTQCKEKVSICCAWALKRNRRMGKGGRKEGEGGGICCLNTYREGLTLEGGNVGEF